MAMAFMKWEEPGMSPAQARALVTQIAEQMEPGWMVADDRYGQVGRMELHGPDGIQLCLQVGPLHVAVRGIHADVGGHLPGRFGCAEPVIRFAVTKSPQRMASEITRRLLPAVRQDAAVLAAARNERDTRLAGRLDTLLKARELLGGNLSWAEPGTGRRPAEFESASTHHRAPGTPHLVIELRDDKGDDHADEVRVSDLTHEQALIIVEAAAAVIARPPR
ncbi:hypothetical protein [Actinomadura rupiterrae]|uniref:hypothetical protein n=1 Tax=Actinomadura rupiterrae TaxID=559627 RepID=UPI0020A432DD|nr:hypothetical protein [Actinomadura rupiterrae]MCP2341155.1 hypothetical protein [Actinomadura rupiterrae]